MNTVSQEEEEWFIVIAGEKYIIINFKRDDQFVRLYTLDDGEILVGTDDDFAYYTRNLFSQMSSRELSNYIDYVDILDMWNNATTFDDWLYDIENDWEEYFEYDEKQFIDKVSDSLLEELGSVPEISFVLY